MKFSNATPFPAAWTFGFERDGRERLVAIVKATYAMPREAGEPALPHPEQQALVRADEFVGEPGLSAPLRETDFAHVKPACDVLLIGQARAPAGRMARRLPVGLRVGGMLKRFVVVGDRHWHQGALGSIGATEPQPFTAMAVGYERAFGGTDNTRLPRSGHVDTYLANPVGRGFRRHTDHIDGELLPNTEEEGHPVTRHDGDYRPMALSPLGRHWSPRSGYAGTYDAHWLEQRSPFWPDDFDERYFQAAPGDQVIPYPQGGEQIVLQHFTEDGLRAFQLPAQAMPVTFIPYRGRDVTRDAVLDTILLEPDHERFTLTWRAGIALGKSVFDVKETIAGEMTEAWHRARRFPNKTYHRSLADAVAAKRARGGR